MVGMEHVADQFDGLLDTAIVNQRRKEAGLPVESDSNHLIFTGPPGTGKTTIARELARPTTQWESFPRDKFTEVNRADLVGEYIGQTAPKTAQEVFDKAKGGVLFIDEAYALGEGRATAGGAHPVDGRHGEPPRRHRGDPGRVSQGDAEVGGVQPRSEAPACPRRCRSTTTTPRRLDKIGRGMLREGQYVGKPGTGAKITEATAAHRIHPRSWQRP